MVRSQRQESALPAAVDDDLPAEPEPAPAGASRPEVAAARRIVVKLGTRVVTGTDGGVATERLAEIVAEVAAARGAGRQVLLVSSGAVGLGRRALGLAEPPERLALRQASAAVGQGRLMALYDEVFARHGVVCAQVLLTRADLNDRRRYLNLRRALEELLERGVVPVINENDVVSTEELELVHGLGHGGGARPTFGDNDGLSAVVATKLGADLLVLLTDVAGVFDRPPGEPGAERLARVDAGGEAVAGAGPPTSGAGRGGMRSKVEAAALAADGGCHAVIAGGTARGVLGRVLAGEEEGTWFPLRRTLDAHHRWIAFAAASRGALELDPGAVDALRSGGASLLAAGVVDVAGDFRRGDVVELVGPGGARVGRGVIRWDAGEVRRWIDGTAPPGVRNAHALIRRSHLVLESVLETAR